MRKPKPTPPVLRAPETYTCAEIDAAIDSNVCDVRFRTMREAYESAKSTSDLTGGRSGYFGIPFPALLPRLAARAQAEENEGGV